MIGKSKSIKKVFDLIEKVTNNKTNVLITGESGVGKELVARAIHFNGNLKEKPFVAVNCGAIPETLIESELFGYKKGSFTGASSDKDGLFKVANTGTIFLDEVGELPMTMQVKLLRVLQDKTFKPVGGLEDIKVDIRIICATNRNLDQMVALGKFREDLYYRLNVIHIKVPSLRDRKEDLPDLITHFVEKLSKRMNRKISGVSQEAMKILLEYDYPGNIRELENLIERAAALQESDQIELKNLPPSLAAKSNGKVTPQNSILLPLNLDKELESHEKKIIEKAFQQANNDIKAAAELLEITPDRMKKRVKFFKLI